MSQGRHKFLRPEDIRKLSGFEFAPRHIVEGYLAGRHLSRARGLSTEFRDYRQYAPGDDPAALDWKVFARTDRHYVRSYEQETNTACYLFLDSSASMGYRGKLDYASFFAAALCYLVARRGDLVSLHLFDATVRKHFPPGSTHAHLDNLLNALERNHPGGQTNLSEALRRSLPLLKRRGSMVVVSDFFDDPAAIFDALGPYLHRGFKVHLFHILSPEELELPGEGLAEYVDLESSRRVVVHAESVRKPYQAALQAHIDGLRRLAARRGVDYSLARTDTHYFQLFDHLVK